MKLKIYAVLLILLASSVLAAEVDNEISKIMESNDEVSVIVFLNDDNEKVFDKLNVKLFYELLPV